VVPPAQMDNVITPVSITPRLRSVIGAYYKRPGIHHGSQGSELF
jgi:hypothetical protein